MTSVRVCMRVCQLSIGLSAIVKCSTPLTRFRDRVRIWGREAQSIFKTALHLMVKSLNAR